MDGAGHGRPRDEIEGLSVADATDAVIDEDDSRDRAATRAALERIAEDGAVTRSGMEDALRELSKVVATPETRLELAEMELDDARDAADPVDDLAVVEDRLNALNTRYRNLDGRITRLGARLQMLMEQASGSTDLYRPALKIQELTDDANEFQARADDLKTDAESFTEWVTTPEVRYDELGEDVSALEAAVEDLDGAVADVAAAIEEADGSDDAEVRELGARWADASLRIQLLELLATDVRAELADHRTWADREDLEATPLDDVEARVDSVDEDLDDLASTVDEIGRRDWVDRFAEPIRGFDRALHEYEPPIPWGEVQSELEEHRRQIQRAA